MKKLTYLILLVLVLVLCAVGVSARNVWQYQETPDVIGTSFPEMVLWNDTSWTTSDNIAAPMNKKIYFNYTVPTNAQLPFNWQVADRYQLSSGQWNADDVINLSVTYSSNPVIGTVFQCYVYWNTTVSANLTQWAYWNPASSVWTTHSTERTYNIGLIEDGVWWNIFQADYKPVLATPSLVPILPTKVTPINASTTYTDANADVGNVTFKWYVNGTNVYNQTITSVNNNTVLNSTLGKGNFSHFQLVNVSVQAFDIYNSSSISWSSQLNVLNTAPTLGNPTVNNTSPTVIDSVRCMDGSYVDQDSDPEVPGDDRTWLWYKNNASTGVTDKITLVSALGMVRYDNISCRERTYDGYNYSNYANSTQIQILNYVPTIQTGNTFTNNPIGHKFNVSAVAYDADSNDIINTNISTSSGSCDYVSNSSTTNTFTSNWNCTGTAGASASVQVGFRDIDSGNVKTTATSNTYPNNLPTFTQSAPSISIRHDQNLTVQLNATDADSDTITWGVNESKIGISSSGLLFDNATQAEAGNYSIKVNITDGYSVVNSTFNYEVINNLPAWVQTFSSVSLNHSQNLNITLNATDTDSDPLTYYINSTMVNIVAATGYLSDNPTQSEKGNYSIKVNATDGKDWISFVWNYEIINRVPTISADNITPVTPYITSTLTGSCTASDPDGDTLTYYYNFYSVTDGTYKGSFSTTTTLPLSPPLDSHDTFRVDCYVNDGSDNSLTRTGTTQRTVANTPPTISVPTITPTTANISTILTCNDGGNYADADGDTRGANQWLWYKNNVSTGITTTTFTVSGNAVVGDWIYCHEKVYDNYDYSIQYNSTQIKIDNTPTTIFLQNTFTNQSNHQFNVTAGVYDEDTASDIIGTNISISSGSCTYAKNSTSGNYFNATYNCSGLGGALANVIINFADKNNNYIATTQSPNTYPNNLPIWTQAITSIFVAHSQNLSLQLNATDSDTVDALTWAVNSSMVAINQSGYISDDPTRLEVGVYAIKVNVTDNQTNSLTTMTFTYTITNDAPIFTQSPTSFSLYHNQNLSVQFNATDANGDEIYWGVNSSLFTINTTGYIFDNPTQAETGNYSVRVNITDNTSTTNLILTYEIMNRAPSGGVIVVSPSSPINADDLYCNITTAITDADNDALTNTFDWFKGGVSQSINAQTLGNGNTTTDDIWYCTLYANDGLVNSPTLQSENSVSIESGLIAPAITYTNATTALTSLTSSSTNPTNNNSWVNLSVTFSDVNTNDKWIAYFCRNSTFTGACASEFCHTTNITDLTLTCRYNVSSETSTTINYWVYVQDNTTLTGSTTGSFVINYPPTTPILTSPLNNTWITKDYQLLTPTSTDPDSDVIRYHIYLNNTVVNTTIVTYNFTGLNETSYYWYVVANDSHGYESSTSQISMFKVDYTSPTIENISMTSSPYYTDTSIMVYADCGDSNSGINTSTAKYNITDILSLTTLESMGYTSGNRFADVYVPLGVAGYYQFHYFRCSDLAGNQADQATSLNFTTSIRPVGGGGGGSSPPITILSTIPSNFTFTTPKFCGDGVCNCYTNNNDTNYCESPGSCLGDCKVNFDNLLTCLIKDPKTCIYSESWFVNILIFVVIGGLVVIFALENQKVKKHKGDNR